MYIMEAGGIKTPNGTGAYDEDMGGTVGVRGRHINYYPPDDPYVF